MGYLHTKDDVSTPLETADRIPIHRSTLGVWQLISLAQLKSPFDVGFPSAGAQVVYGQTDPLLSLSDGYSSIRAATGNAGSVSEMTGTDTGRIGEADISTGTNTNGWAGLVGGGANTMGFGGGRHRVRFDVQIPTASDGTDTFTVRVGYCEYGHTTVTDGAWFEYTHSVNSGQWVCYTKAGGTATSSNSSVAAAAAGYQVLEIEVNAAASSVSFYIDGSAAVTAHTTNIPSGTSQSTRLFGGIAKSAGTTARSLYADTVAWSFEPTTAL